MGLSRKTRYISIDPWLVCRDCPVNIGFVIPVKDGSVVEKQAEENGDGE